MARGMERSSAVAPASALSGMERPAAATPPPVLSGMERPAAAPPAAHRRDARTRIARRIRHTRGKT